MLSASILLKPIFSFIKTNKIKATKTGFINIEVFAILTAQRFERRSIVDITPDSISSHINLGLLLVFFGVSTCKINDAIVPAFLASMLKQHRLRLKTIADAAPIVLSINAKIGKKCCVLSL